MNNNDGFVYQEGEWDFDDEMTQEIHDIEEEDTEDQQMISDEREELMEIVPCDLEDIHEWINDLQGKDQRIFDEMLAEFGGLEPWLHFAGFMVEDVTDWFLTEA